MSANRLQLGRTATKTKSKSKTKTTSGSKSKSDKRLAAAAEAIPNGEHEMPRPPQARARQLMEQPKHRNPPKLRTQIDVDSDRYPFCLVWAPLPVITWFIPLIGHTGISNSQGVIYDFSDDFNISVDNFSFGSPTKYYQFDPNELSQANKSEAWDQAIKETSDYYAKTRHSLCFNNCHQYIATVLNKLQYGQANDWDQSDMCKLITFHSSYTGYLGFIRQWWPFSVLMLAVIVFCCLIIMS